MTVALTGTGGIFTRLGRIGKAYRNWNSYQSGIRTNFEALYDNYPNNYSWLGQLPAQEDPLTRTEAGLLQQAQSLAITTLINQVTADNPLIQPTVGACLVELIRQMVASSDSVARQTVAVTPTAISGSTGNGTIRTSTTRPDGLPCELAIAETAKIVCTGDFQSGTATAGSEPFLFTGDPNTARPTDWDWPQGSAAAISFAANDGSRNSILTNGGFDTWASSSPTGWTVANATESTGAYDGGSALSLTAGATGSAVQPLNDLTAGNKLTPVTAYCLNFWMKASGALSAGALKAELVDGSGTVINDSQGTANELTVAYGSITTGWTSTSTWFRTPRVLTDDIDFRFRASTAFTGGNVLVDRAALVSPSAYPGGYGFAVFSGSTKFVIGDGWTVAATNDRASSTYCSTFQSLFEKLFGMSTLGLMLPSSGSPTIADTLITS